MTDLRSPAAATYRRLYSTRRWRDLRADQLRRRPLCAMCLPAITAATVCDHIEPHRGDQTKFWDPANLQSLCDRHHSRDKQIVEAGGIAYEATPDATGWPTDLRHPSNRPRRGVGDAQSC